MPIFQDDLELAQPPEPDSQPIIQQQSSLSISRRLSEESLPTELCEGLVSDSPPLQSTAKASQDEPLANDRTDFISRLKRTQSPTWNPDLDHLLRQAGSTRPSTPTRPASRSSGTLLPPVQITPEKSDAPNKLFEERLIDGLSIERPRSALHSGDFTDDAPARRQAQLERTDVEKKADSLLANAWTATSPPRHFTPFDRRNPGKENGDFQWYNGSPPSSSLSSFAYQPPTSPLVQSESNDELDMATVGRPIHLPTSWTPPRRYSAYAAGSPTFSSSSVGSSFSQRTPLHRREGSLPYQAHQPRRSLTSTPSFLSQEGSPRPPAYMRSRRQSYSSDLSPIQPASMVGSYEESILCGRMSTGPSKPLEFVAQIGVLGKGDCKPSLKCPKHVTLPFPAVYFSYKKTAYGRSQADDGPSPYTGMIDLENGLANAEDDLRSKRKASSRYSDKKPAESTETANHGGDADHRMASRSKRRVGSPKAPPGGSYRIPEKGQVQIVIKNPNKTAVKLFLIPYDLTGMEPGSKTLIRQRSWSTGPIIDNVPSDVLKNDVRVAPVLRYLVQLHMCCPSKGRFYLYKSINVVFANRVPDDKEKLQNETIWPEPRFSTYKYARVNNPPMSGLSVSGAALSAEKAHRRRSMGFPIEADPQAFDLMDGITSSSTISPEPLSNMKLAQARGFRAQLDVNGLGIQNQPLKDDAPVAVADGNRQVVGSCPPNVIPTSQGDMMSLDSHFYEKRNKGDPGYGANAYGNMVRDGSVGRTGTEGLLSQRLRSLGMKGAMPESPEHAME